MFEKEIVIDGKGHIMGRLAAVVAKELLNGQRVVVVRAEQLVLSGLLYNRRVEHLEWKGKNSNTNPRRGGPYHYKAPAKLMWKCIKGMLPRKTARGKSALERLKVFEGCPFPYSNIKKTYVPKALKVVRLKFGRKSTTLGELSTSVGWNMGSLVEKLEQKRNEKGQVFHKAKLELKKKICKIEKENKEVVSLRQQLAQYGF